MKCSCQEQLNLNLISLTTSLLEIWEMEEHMLNDHIEFTVNQI